MKHRGDMRQLRELCLVAIATVLALGILISGARPEVAVLAVLGILTAALVLSGIGLGRTTVLALTLLLAGCLLTARSTAPPSGLALLLLPALPASTLLGGFIAQRLRESLPEESPGGWSTITVAYQQTPAIPGGDRVGSPL